MDIVLSGLRRRATERGTTHAQLLGEFTGCRIRFVLQHETPAFITFTYMHHSGSFQHKF